MHHSLPIEEQNIHQLMSAACTLWGEARWEPELEEALLHGIRTVALANLKASPPGSFGLRDIPRLFTDLAFCVSVLHLADDIGLRAWWCVFLTRPLDWQRRVIVSAAQRIVYLERTWAMSCLSETKTNQKE